MTAAEKRALPALAVSSADLTPPRMLNVSTNPFNVGSSPQKYRPNELRAGREGDTDRTQFFLERLEWLTTRLGGAVPYAFKTSDGAIRSLDKGCIGFLHEQGRIRLHLDRSGFIASVAPAAAGRRKHEFTVPELQSRGAAPTFAFLIAAVERGAERVTYGQLAAVLNGSLGYRNVTAHHVGYVVGALMGHLEALQPDVPLINVMVVRSVGNEPGGGADEFLRRRFNPERLTERVRKRLVRRALNEVANYADWRALYQRAFGSEPPARDVEMDAEYDDDGQPDNPKNADRFGGPESAEHKRLKQYVKDSPDCLRLGLKHPRAEIERNIISGDRLDVQIIDGVRRIAVEVKSIRSGEPDLERGIYQCVKYKAVLEAQCLALGVTTPCEAILVHECKLPPRLLQTARRLGVRHVRVRVNPTTASAPSRV